MREKIAYRTVQVLSQGPYYRDEIIQVGLYRSHPCRHPLRMVSVLWQGAWYRYLTNVLDPQTLTARQVCELYRRRWRIEDAFAVTKRLLDLAYVWTGSHNAVQLQIYATLIFYAVLLTICQQVAQVLGEPLERISVEMVFRAFYHYSRAVQRGETDDLVQFLAEHAKLLGIVKRWRKHHRERQQLESIMWGDDSAEVEVSRDLGAVRGDRVYERQILSELFAAYPADVARGRLGCRRRGPHPVFCWSICKCMRWNPIRACARCWRRTVPRRRSWTGLSCPPAVLPTKVECGPDQSCVLPCARS